MRTTNWSVFALQACALVICLAACSTIGVAQPEGTGVVTELKPTTLPAEFIPLFAARSDAAIDPVNANSLMPSGIVNYLGANNIVWLPGGKGAVLASENSMMLLSTSELVAGAQADSPEMIQTISSNTPSHLSVAREAAILAWVSDGKKINVLDATNNVGEPILTQSVSPVTGLTLTPNGNRLAYATFSREVVIQKTGDEQSTETWITPAWLANLSYSPDGSQLGGADLANFTFYILDANNGTIVQSREWTGSATSALYGVYLSPDWTRAAWVTQSAIQMMELSSGKIGPLLSHANVVNAVAWSPNSLLLATASAVMVGEDLAPAVLIWEADSGSLINTLVQPTAVQDLTFSPDGRQLAILHINGDLQSWSVSP